MVVLDEPALLEVPLVGLGYRPPIADWLLQKPEVVDCVEVTAEHFFAGGDSELAALGAMYPVSVHGLGLSLGTPGGLDTETLRQFKRVADRADARWISEHLAFTKTGDVDLGHLNPIPLNQRSLQTMIEHSRQLIDYCQRPLLLENITSQLRLPEEIAEADFINLLCDKSGAGLLLDVTNLFINSRNHRFDPVQWLEQIEPAVIRQIHLVGYSYSDGVWHDRHNSMIQEELFDLAETVIRYAPVEAVIIERDGCFPELPALEQELQRLEAVCETARCS